MLRTRLAEHNFASERGVSSRPQRGQAIAFCGSRGVPANYGGFETAVDEISQRFVNQGYDCEVFCRLSSSDKLLEKHEGRRLVYERGSKSRVLDTFVSSIQTGWYLLRYRKQYAHVFWFNNASFPGIFMTWLARIPMSVNTDGLEWRRAKWSWPFKAYYLLCSFLVCRMCKNVISDSFAIQAHYRRYFNRETSFVPYGVPAIRPVAKEKQEVILQKYRLKPRRYFLQITRFEPDNLPLAIARAFEKSGLWRNDYKLVLVGYKEATPYACQVKNLDGQHGIEVKDATYDPDELFVLRSNCFCYVHGNSVGGTNPALLEAMATCPRVMAIDGEFSHEVLGDTGLFFDPADIVSVFNVAVESEERAVEMQRRVQHRYQWDEVANSYMRLAQGEPAGYAVMAEVHPSGVTTSA